MKLLTFLLCLLTFTACDVPPEREAERVDLRGLEDIGQPWGPCKGGPGGECADGAFCRGDANASICAPACAKVCPPVPVDACGDAMGVGECADDGVCLLGCVDDGDCGIGMACVSGTCAWPG